MRSVVHQTSALVVLDSQRPAIRLRGLDFTCLGYTLGPGKGFNLPLVHYAAAFK